MKDMIRCYRCAGSGKVYKIGGGYSQVNIGGEHISCPFCSGCGKIEKLSEEKKMEFLKESKAKKKDVEYGKET